MQNIQNKKLINTIYSNVMHRIKIYRWNHMYIRTIHVKIIFVDFNKQNSIFFFYEDKNTRRFSTFNQERIINSASLNLKKHQKTFF